MDMHALAMGEHATTTIDTALASRIAELEAENAQLRKERDQLCASHARLREELELLERRIFVAKAERVDTAQLELEFADKLRASSTRSPARSRTRRPAATTTTTRPTTRPTRTRTRRSRPGAAT